jgi:uncharacterized protein
MKAPMQLDTLNIALLTCAFGMGFLVPRGTTCAVAAVIEGMVRKKAWRFGGFGLAVLVGLVLRLPLVWSHALPLHSAPMVELGWLVILGGLVFGVGAALNGACIFGTLNKVVSGDTSYLFVVPGMWLGSIVIGTAHLKLAPKIVAGGPQAVWVGVVIWIVAVLAMISAMAFFHRKGRLDKALTMSGIGLFGTLLYTLHPYWGYSSIVSDFAQDAIMSPTRMGDGLLPFLVIAACVGGLMSSVQQGKFKLRAPKLQPCLGALAGGFLMTFGIAMIPGGNDGIILSLLPSLVPAGIVAYIAMNVGIALTLTSERWLPALNKGRVRDA